MTEPDAYPAHGEAPPRPGRAWSQVWQLPVLVIGVLLFAAGIWFAMPQKPRIDPVQILDQAAYDLQANNLDAADQALSRLSGILGPESDADKAQRARFLQYQADLNYLQLQSRGPVAARSELAHQTYRQIADDYDKATALGRTLGSQAIERYVQTLAILGKDKQALAMVDRLPAQAASERCALIRSLIDRRQSRSDRHDPAAIAPLMVRFKQELKNETDPARKREQEIWIAAVEARMEIESNKPQQAIDYLLRNLQRFSAGPQADRSELLVLLAQAYQKTGAFDDAKRMYLYAQGKLAKQSPLHAQVLLGLGQIALLSGNDSSVREALEHFTTAVKNYPSEPAYLDALIDKADCEARLGTYEQALDDLREAVKRLVQDASPWDSRRQLVTDIARSHMTRAMDQQHYQRALDFLTLLTPLHEGGAAATADDAGTTGESTDMAAKAATPDTATKAAVPGGMPGGATQKENLPARMLLDFAVIHEKIAEQFEQRALAIKDKMNQEGDDAGKDLKVFEQANQQAAVHYDQAGEYYLRHADAVSATDDEAHGQSLWKSATCFNKAQDWKRAIGVYEQFVKTRKTDALQLAAILQLGKAYMADDQYGPASTRFEQLIEEHPNSPEAFDALVPLARAYMGLKRTDAAERTLLKVVTDHPAITPQSVQYRQALIALGKLYYRLGRTNSTYFVPAIERLEEAVQRYGRTDQGGALRYLLADAYRLSVPALDKQLADKPSHEKQLALRTERTRRLNQAQMYYNQAIHQLEAKPPHALTPLEKLYHRNAYFYQADCAYDRGAYREAISLYDTAARRWKDQPASLVALVQIVNAYCELGEYKQAKAANDAARWRLKHIPDKAFDDPTLPMTRKQWEDWLRWTHELNLFGSQANAK